MDTNKVIRDIKSLKIQGAENIAKAAAELILANYNRLSFTELRQLAKKLESLRITEPCLRNTIFYMFNSSKDVGDLKIKAEETLRHFDEAKEKIIEIGARKISNNMVIYTHCHSATVIKILEKAKNLGKKIFVHCTETRPRFQGRITARELTKLGIPTTLYVDSAMRIAIKKADLCLIGADAITAEGKVVNKMGSEIAARICNDLDIPIYSCTNSWKFDPQSIFGYEEEIEQRSAKEIWENAPKELTISTLAFEKVAPELITGIISEIGVYKPSVFVEEIGHHYPWLITER